ncbi:MAG: HAD family phosphatase [Thermoplasmata archaeon]|nr:HAD family phosphatase [Thermoplasmata archaeon]
MARVALLLWDIGGVLLSNGWDRSARARASGHFGLDAADLEHRHQQVDAAFESGQLDTDGYLDSTVFYRPRDFTRDAFRQFMREQSAAIPSSLELARHLRERGEFVMAALNNESRELNEYRIATFQLGKIFHAFFSSCYTGRRKPEPDAYRFALQITQRDPAESVFLDDRPENVEAAQRLGLRTILVRDPERLSDELTRVGVAAG